MMGRPRKDPFDPKWAEEEIVPGPLVHVPIPNNDELMLAVLMAGFIARGGPFGYDTMLRQAKEIVAMIKGAA